MPVPDTGPLVVAPTPTPFTADDRVDLDAMSRNIDRWLQTPLSGFVLGTANGEENVLTDAEKIAIVRAVHEARRGQRTVIAGIDEPSAAGTLRLAGLYADAGADLVRVRIPRGLDSDAVRSYFTTVIAASPLPVIVIHQTFGSGPAASPEVIGEVCAMDNVFGYITDHDIRYEGWVRAFFPEEKRFWICNGGLLAYGTLIGANGACMWLGNIAPQLCMDIVATGGRGDFQTARELQTTASMLDRQIGEFGLKGVKAALSLLGYEMSGPRAPVPSASADAIRQVKSALRDAGLLA